MRYLLSLQTSNLSIAHETRDSFSSSFSQIFLVYLQPFRGSSTFEVCTRAENSKKNTKTPYFGGSRSFKVIDVNTAKKLVTSDSHDRSISRPICNCFHARHQGRIWLAGGLGLLVGGLGLVAYLGFQKGICCRITGFWRLGVRWGLLLVGDLGPPAAPPPKSGPARHANISNITTF